MAYEGKWNEISPSYFYPPKKNTCPPVHLNNKQLTQTDDAKYLCVHLDRTLTWPKHITTKWKQLDLKLRKFYRFIGGKLQLSVANWLLVHQAMPKPVWTYSVQLWGSASNSKKEILERFQPKVLRIIMDSPWFVPNAVIIRDVQLLSVRQEVRNCSVTYRQRLNDHPNGLIKSLFQRPTHTRRLKRYYPVDMRTRFNWYSATPQQTIPNHLWLSLNRRCVAGCISHVPSIVTVNIIAECFRTDSNILGDDNKKMAVSCQTHLQLTTQVILIWGGFFKRFVANVFHVCTATYLWTVLLPLGDLWWVGMTRQ